MLYCRKKLFRLIFVMQKDMQFTSRTLLLMNFQDLHELLRLELLRRIDRGSLTRSRLAEQAGFQQARISNFLNRKRALSLEGLDRVLASQNLTIEQILPVDLAAASLQGFQENEPIDAIPVVS